MKIRRAFSLGQIAALCFIGTPIAGAIGLLVNLVASGKRWASWVCLVGFVPITVVVVLFALVSESPFGACVALLLTIVILGMSHVSGTATSNETARQSWWIVGLLSLGATLVLFTMAELFFEA
jgi:general stress protein CsbA